MSCAILYIRGVGNASSVGRLVSLIKQFWLSFVASSTDCGEISASSASFYEERSEA